MQTKKKKVPKIKEYSNMRILRYIVKFLEGN